MIKHIISGGTAGRGVQTAVNLVIWDVRPGLDLARTDGEEAAGEAEDLIEETDEVGEEGEGGETESLEEEEVEDKSVQMKYKVLYGSYNMFGRLC